MKNRWVSNIREAVDVVQRSMSDNDLPAYLVIDGLRIPFEVASVALRRRTDVPYEDYELEIAIAQNPLSGNKEGGAQ